MSAPPSTSLAGVHSMSRPKPRHSARRCQPSCSFRPRGFSPPRRLAPPAGSRACCISQPTMGSTGFLHLDAACLPRLSVRPLLCTCPPEHSPSKQPFARHRAPLPPRRSPPSWDGGATSRPCSAGKSERHTRRCRRACLSWLSWVSLAPVLTTAEAMAPSDDACVTPGEPCACADPCGVRCPRCSTLPPSSASSQRRVRRVARRPRVLSDATTRGDFPRSIGPSSALEGPPSPRCPEAPWIGGL